MANVRRLFKFRVKDRTYNFQHIPNLALRRQRVFEELDATHFQTLVVVVAGLGFFTDGYDIFALGLIIPMLGHVYQKTGGMPTGLEIGMRAATLIGTLIGQISFGILADLYGRQKMYGWELIIVAGGSIAMAMSAEGVGSLDGKGSMNLWVWLIIWRVLMGIGIGGDYPLSAVITSEFAPKKSRARMISSVFYMQPVGYLVATAVALIALVAHKGRIPQDPNKFCFVTLTDTMRDPACQRALDSVWRWVVGIGAVPAFVAMLFRFSIPESPRYTVDVLNRPDSALRDMTELKSEFKISTANQQQDIERPNSFDNNHPQAPPMGGAHDSVHGTGYEMDEIQPVPSNTSMGIESSRPDSQLSYISDVDDAVSEQSVELPKRPNRWARFTIGFREHFITNGHWPTLVGTALAWACFDFAFYALSPNSYKVVNTIFNRQPWSKKSERSVYSDLFDNLIHSLQVVSTSALLGGLLMIILIKRNSPRTIQLYGFLILAALFIAIGVCFHLANNHYVNMEQDSPYVPVMALLYALCQIFFEIGPNFTTFMIPAELFPTRFRCTAHGISAASGKLASVLVQVFVQSDFKHVATKESDKPSSEPKRLGTVVLAFVPFMLVGAAVTQWLIPETRNPDGSNRSLEELECEAKLLRPRSGSVSHQQLNPEP